MVEFRPIEITDNQTLAKIIRSGIEEFDIPRNGTAYTDPTTDNLFQLFQSENSFYYVAIENNEILGGCGIFPTQNLPENCAELVRFFLTQNARNKGIGKKLMQKCIDLAQEIGYNSIYLESFPEMKKAISLYEKLDFEYLNSPLGNSGHYACNVWMLKKLKNAKNV